jgi:tRNA nucleotidyltransferase (CCA-adding enzyme)
MPELPEEVIARASPELLGELRAIAQVSAASGVPVWLVGGLVRDLWLGRPSTDIDLVTIGPPGELARLLAKGLGGAVTEYGQFLTANLVSNHGFAIDVVRARSEAYGGPAELPRVRPGSLEDDLFRRDFTVNAMAVSLGEPQAGLIDPFGGLQDLESRLLRVLHQESFLDDPTRLLRGLRLAVDLDFAFEAGTAELARESVTEGALDLLSGERVRRDLARILVDPARALDALERAADLGIDGFLHPKLVLSSSSAARLRHLADCRAALVMDEEEPQWWLLILIVLAWELAEEERLELARRLSLKRQDSRELVLAADRVEAAVARLTAEGSEPSLRYAAVAQLSPVQRILLQALGGPRAEAFLDEEWPRLREVRLGFSGDELVRRGYRPGPSLGQALEETLRARLEGRIPPEDELDFALAWLDKKSGC